MSDSGAQAGGTPPANLHIYRSLVSAIRSRWAKPPTRPAALEPLEPRLLLSADALSGWDADGGLSDDSLGGGQVVVAEPSTTAGVAYQQAADALGLVVIEAEVHDANIARGGQAWQLVADPDAAGGQLMQALPDLGNSYPGNYVGNAPRLDFTVDFVQSGLHYVWFRGAQVDAGDDSLHIGLDGAEVESADTLVPRNQSELHWNNRRKNGSVAVIDVPTAGRHTVNLWMREDGMPVDRILLTRDIDYLPTGEGPATSPRYDPAASSISGTVWADLNADGTRDPNEPGMAGVTVYLDDNDNGSLAWADSNGDGAWDAGEGERWLLSAHDDPATTGADETGQYHVEGLTPGEYVVRQVVPTGFEETTPLLTPTQVGKLVPGDGEAGDYFGFDVAIDGDVALVGAYQDDPHGDRSGAVYVFRWNGSTWAPEARITPRDPHASQLFGYSVAIDGNTAVIGALGDDDGGSLSGAAYIYQCNGVGWFEQTKLTASDAVRYAEFGRSVAVDGNTVLVGANGDDDRGVYTGAAYVFQWDGASWGEQAKLTASDGYISDQFGYSVAIDGDTALVGARYDDDHGSASGSAYIFRRDGTIWDQEIKLRAADGAGNDQFGSDVAIDGVTAVVGAISADGHTIGTGGAYVFRWDGTAWSQQAKLTGSDTETGSRFGHSVAIEDGTVVVGAPQEEVAGWSSGSAYEFLWTGTAWVQQAKLTADDGSSYDFFGWSVAVASEHALIGAYGDVENGSSSGSAYIFSGFSQPGRYRTVLAGEPVTGHNLGNTRTAVGAPDLDASSDAGFSDTDNLTNRNNASAGNTLSFTVGDVLAGDTVALYATATGGAPVLLGQATATGSSVTVVTDGSTALTDGAYDVTATVTDQYGTWPASQPLRITVDTAAPSPSVDPLTTTDTRPPLTGTIDDPAGFVQVSLDLTDYYQAVNHGNGTWSLMDNFLPELAVGEHDVYLRTYDAAGNDMTFVSPNALSIVPMPRLSVSDASVIEGDDGATQITFTVSVDNPFLDTSRLDWRLLSASATPNVDYNASISGSLVWFAGQDQPLAVDIEVFGDGKIEPDESFLLEIYRHPTYGSGTWQIADSRGTGTIVNDDIETYTSSIGGVVWSDLGADAMRDVGEPGLPGVTIYLDDNDNATLDWADGDSDNAWDAGEGERWMLSAQDDPATAGVDEAGRYLFTGLASGDHIVRQVQAQAYDPTSPISSLVLIDETFPAFNTFDETVWTPVGGPYVNSHPYTEPSTPYALRLTGTAEGGQQLVSRMFDLSTAASAQLAFYESRWYADSNESLAVDYRNGQGEWVEAWKLTGNGYAYTFFTSRSLNLPAAALHDQAAIRFRYTGTDSDDWYVDNIRLSATGAGKHTLSVPLDTHVEADFGNWALPPFEVVSSSVSDGDNLAVAPSTIDLDLSVPFEAASVQAGDLRVDGVAAPSVSMVDADTLRFTLPALADGVHTVELITGSVLDYKGRPVAGSSLSFTLDTVAPRVVATTLQDGDELAAGPLTWSVTFSEAIDAAYFDTYSMRMARLKGQPSPIDAHQAAYDAATRTATFSWNSVPEGNYELSLWASHIRDTAGNMLDGEATWPLPPEGSGDGVPGGNFAMDLLVDARETRTLTYYRRMRPLGSLVLSSRGNTGYINSAHDTDSFATPTVAGQPMTIIVTPTAATATLSVTGFGAAVTAAAPGEAVVLSLTGDGSPGGFTVSGDGETGYGIEAYTNAALELADADAAAPLAIDPSAMSLGNGRRWAIVGQHELADLYALNVDQEQVNVGGWWNVTSFAPLGQEIVPTFSSLDRVQLHLQGFGADAAVMVRLRAGTIDGAILSESGPVAVPEQAGWVTFDLPAAAVTPGQTYVLELVDASGADGYALVGGSDETYAPGRAILHGAPVTSDLAFRAGVATAAPAGDVYTLDLTGHAGRRVDVLYSALPGGQNDLLELIGPDGTVLATASGGLDNADVGILGCLVPADGVYRLRVVGTAAGAYSLVVTGSLTFEAETNDAATDPVRPLTGDDTLGYVGNAGQAIFGLATTHGQGGQVVEIDPATGLPMRTVVSASTSFDGLAYDGEWLYALTSAEQVLVLDPVDGSLHDTLTIDMKGQANYRRMAGLTVYDDHLVAGSAFNNLLFFIDKATGERTRTLSDTWPGEFPGDLIAVPERGSIFIGGPSYVVEVDAESGQTLNTLDLSDHVVRMQGLAWRDGELVVAAPSYPAAGGNGGTLTYVNPDTGNILEQVGADGPFYSDLAGAGPLAPPHVPALGDPWHEAGDAWGLHLSAGQTLTLSTRTPFDAAGGALVNELDPTLVLYGPDGLVAAVDTDTASDGRNARLTYTATGTGVYRVQVLAHTGRGEYLLETQVDEAPAAQVVGRHLLYNASGFDGNNAAANSGDDDALAPDKHALLPGQTATFANYSTYSRGINGLVVDIANLADAAGLTLANLAGYFAFRVGNDSDAAGWATAPAPVEVAVRPGAGVDGSDRVTLIWADQAIQKQWLQVIIRASEATGLTQDNVFYFGNAIGETGNSATDAKVDVLDIGATRAHQTGRSPAPITSLYDFNRDRRVDILDIGLARTHQSGRQPLTLITAPSLAPSIAPLSTARTAPTTTEATPDTPSAAPDTATFDALALAAGRLTSSRPSLQHLAPLALWDSLTVVDDRQPWRSVHDRSDDSDRVRLPFTSKA